MAQARLAVYPPPPDALLPYLGVVIHEDGAVQAMAFDTGSAAFVHDAAIRLAKLADEAKPDRGPDPQTPRRSESEERPRVMKTRRRRVSSERQALS